MDSTHWLKQNTDKPLFPDLIWNKPENKNHAGKLLIIGGNAHEFAAPAEAYNEAEKSGIGVAKVLLPNVLQKTVGAVLENGEFATSNKSGSFNRQALSEWIEWGAWADGVLIAGDLGRNSETAVVLESFLEKYRGQVTITKDAIEYSNHQPKKLFERTDTTIVASFSQLQKLCSAAGWHKPLKFSMTLAQLVEFLQEIGNTYECNIVTEHNGIILVAVGGKVSTTKLKIDETWRVKTAAHSAVWTLQNPSKLFEALTCGVLVKST